MRLLTSDASCEKIATMSKDTQNTQSSGIGFTGLLTVLFVGLKLTNHIDWSWWWVLSPMWITAVTVFLLATVLTVLEGKTGWRR